MVSFPTPGPRRFQSLPVSALQPLPQQDGFYVCLSSSEYHLSVSSEIRETQTSAGSLPIRANYVGLRTKLAGLPISRPKSTKTGITDASLRFDHCAPHLDPAPGCTAKAMSPGLDSADRKHFGVKTGYRLREAGIYLHLQHLIEVAIGWEAGIRTPINRSRVCSGRFAWFCRVFDSAAFSLSDHLNKSALCFHDLWRAPLIRPG